MSSRSLTAFALALAIFSFTFLQAGLPAEASAGGGIESLLRKLDDAVRKQQWNWAAHHAKDIAVYYDNNK